MSQAYIDGYDAYMRGDDITLCPYDELDAQSDQWEDGWLDAEAGGIAY